MYRSKKINKGYKIHGPKEKLAEYHSTVTFYTKTLLISNIVYLLIQNCLFWDTLSMPAIVCYIGTSIMSWLSRYFIKNLDMNVSDARMGPVGDVNESLYYMQAHIAENFKETVIFTIFLHILSLISEYCWLLLLTVPVCYFIDFCWSRNVRDYTLQPVFKSFSILDF